MLTVIKFIENPNEDNDNRVISRTLGKIGVFNYRDSPLIPKPGEFWQVEIIKEVIIHRENGSAGGCFVLEPVRKIGQREGEDSPNIDHLIPGGYKTVRFHTSLILVPKISGFNWITEKDLRHHLRDEHHQEDGTYGINSFVVSLDGSEEWPIEESGKGAPPSDDGYSTIYSGR